MIDESCLGGIVNAFEDAICLLDGDGRVRMANAAARSLLGCHADELAGERITDAFAAGALAPFLKRVLATGKTCLEESGEFTSKRGVPVAVSFSLYPVHEGGRVTGAVLRFRETSPPEVCDLALRDSETKLGAILDTISDGVVAVDAHGAIQLFNPAAEVLFGYRREEVMGLNVSILMPSPDRDAHDGYLANYLRTGVRKIIGIGREVIGKRKDGSLFPLYLSIGEAFLGPERTFVAVLHDLTYRKQAEEKLQTLSRIVEQSPNAILMATMDGLVEYVNPSFTRLTGYGREDVEGKITPLLPSPSASPVQYRKLEEILLEGCEWREEIQDNKKSGETYWAQKTITYIRNAEGKISHFLVIQQDITEQRRDKMALQASEERFRQVAEMSGEWLWEQDPDGRYIYSSGAVRQILGYDPEEILGKSYLNLLTEEDKRRWTTELPPTREVQKPFYRLINRYCHKDGHEVFTESTGEPFLDERGRLIKWRGVDHDVTARKRYEDALRLRDRAIEAASVGINIADARKNHNPNIYVNPALSRMTGYSREELIGQSMSILQGPDTERGAIEEIGRALSEGRSCELVLKNYRKGGAPFWNELFIAPVRDPEARLTHFIGIHSDVTEKRRAEEEQRELEIAKQVQLSLLPKAPLTLEGVRVAGVCLPATHVGGDYYDYFFSRDTLNVIIADVSGHSMGAALIMAGVRSALKAQTRKADPSKPDQGAAEVLTALNELLYDDLNGADLFISVFYLRYNSKLKHLCYANAGHNCPLLLSEKDACCRELDAEGLVFGVRKHVEFEEKCQSLQSGDKLLIYTDGITEAQNSGGEFFGTARLCDLFSSLKTESPPVTIERIIESLQRFCGTRTFNDDISMVVMKVD